MWQAKFLILGLLLGGVALAMPWLAYRRLKALTRRHGGVLLVRGISGAQAARIILLRGKIEQVDVDETSLAITDYYSAFEPAIKLSPESYHGRTLFDVARAARLAGHALQHRDRRLGSQSSWDSFMILWGNGWPFLLLAFVFMKEGTLIFGLLTFSAIAAILAALHATKHRNIVDAARRGRAELEAANLLDGHPREEVDAAFTAACLENLALPYTRTWWGMLVGR
jgi:Zn-dependent membrane protease YugP